MQSIKVVMLGDCGVGKSSIVGRFVSNEFTDNEYPTTNAMMLSKIMDIPGTSQKVKFAIWDTAGQERYRSLASAYYHDAAAAVLVYDITNRPSFDLIRDWVSELKSKGPDDIVLAIAGNKSDLLELEVVSSEEGQQYAEEIHAIFTLASAKDGTGIEELFTQICLKLKPDLQRLVEQSQEASFHVSVHYILRL